MKKTFNVLPLLTIIVVNKNTGISKKFYKS